VSACEPRRGIPSIAQIRAVTAKGGSWAMRHSDLSDFSYNDLRVHQGRVEFYCQVIGMKGWYEMKPRDVMGIEFQPVDSKQRPIPWSTSQSGWELEE
jgi:hypothetical protein